MRSAATLSLSLALLGAQDALAFFRMGCGDPLVVERADPLMYPGVVSDHLHTISGGNAFDFNMTAETARTSTCSTCPPVEDLSNYWTSTLMFQTKAGKFIRVPQNGGTTVYYLQRAKDNGKVRAFPPGFRMIAGNANLRSYDDKNWSHRAVTHVCLDFTGSGAGGETPYLPDHRCPQGIRTQVFFPACWDGKNLDSPDHKSHMAYPIENFNGGRCPDTHPVQMVSLFYEVHWATDKFADEWYEANDMKQPFVLSSGDPTGRGFHADFINGWNEEILQRAVDECTNNSGEIKDCPVLKLRSGDDMKNCKLVNRVPEAIDGELDRLPGCNPIFKGPEDATPVPASACDATQVILPKTFTGLPPVEGWTPLGCAKDDPDNRTLEKKFLDPKGAMTPTWCGEKCKVEGFTYAGLQFKNECWCGNSFDSNRLGAGGCDDPCEGNPTIKCGGGQRLSMYKAGAEPSLPEPSSSSSVPPSWPGDSPTGSESQTDSPQTETGPSPTESQPSSTPTDTTSGNEWPWPEPSSSETDTQSETPISPPDETPGNTGLPGPTLTMTDTDSSSLPSHPTNLPTLTMTETEDGPAPSPTAPSKDGWTEVGCHVDPLNPRALTGARTSSNKQTPSTCKAFCAERNFKYAGTEHGGECFCGNELTAGTIPAQASECNIPCEGDGSFMCGGSARLTLYQVGESSAPEVTPSDGATNAPEATTTTTTRRGHRWPGHHQWRPTADGTPTRRSRDKRRL